MRHPTPPPMINNVQHPMSSSAAPHMSSNVPLLMSNNAAHPMRLATRQNAPVVTEAMVDMARSARRFPSKAARVSQCRPLPNSALRSLRRTANRFQSKFQNRTANRSPRKTVSKSPSKIVIKFPRKSVSRCLSRHQQKFQDRSVRSKDMDMAIDLLNYNIYA